MPFGSAFSNLKEFNATTADDKILKLKNTTLTRAAFKILGIPHIGIRLRARKIMKNIPKKYDSLLDAGCGTGIYSISLSKKFRKINAIDISEEKIRHLVKNAPIKNIFFEKQDLCKLKFKNNSFDVIICSDVLEHIKNDEKAFSELARVLKNGGTLLITVPYNSKNNQETYKRYSHERAGYDFKNINNLAKELDLKIIEICGYSYSLTDKISNFSYKFINNKFLLAIIFYPLWLLALITDFLKIGEPNGIFIKLEK